MQSASGQQLFSHHSLYESALLVTGSGLKVLQCSTAPSLSLLASCSGHCTQLIVHLQKSSGSKLAAAQEVDPNIQGDRLLTGLCEHLYHNTLLNIHLLMGFAVQNL